MNVNDVIDLLNFAYVSKYEFIYIYISNESSHQKQSNDVCLRSIGQTMQNL